MAYTVEQVHAEDLELDTDLVRFIGKVAGELSDLYGAKYNWSNFKIKRYVHFARMMVCRRDGKLVGLMMYHVGPPAFDHDWVIARQDLLWGEKGTRAVKLLMDEFIDFGKENANDIITMVGAKTNISERTLDRMGFKKLETLYSQTGIAK